MNINDITITSLETINAFDIVTGAYKFTLDELQNATIAQTQEKTDITGKQGRKLNSLKKTGTRLLPSAAPMVLCPVVCSNCRLAASSRIRRPL